MFRTHSGADDWRIASLLIAGELAPARLAGLSILVGESPAGESDGWRAGESPALSAGGLAPAVVFRQSPPLAGKLAAQLLGVAL